MARSLLSIAAGSQRAAYQKALHSALCHLSPAYASEAAAANDPLPEDLAPSPSPGAASPQVRSRPTPPSEGGGANHMRGSSIFLNLRTIHMRGRGIIRGPKPSA